MFCYFNPDLSFILQKGSTAYQYDSLGNFKQQLSILNLPINQAVMVDAIGVTNSYK